MLLFTSTLFTLVICEHVRVAELVADKAPVDLLPTPLARRGSGRTANMDSIQNDKKSTDNEMLDPSTKDLLQNALSQLQDIKAELKEARQERSRLSSGISEMGGQVRTIVERKDQIKQKIRKLTKTLTKKDHHRKVKSGLRSLQQDHERILQAMSKAKILNRASNRRNNRNNNSGNDTLHSNDKTSKGAGSNRSHSAHRGNNKDRKKINQESNDVRVIEEDQQMTGDTQTQNPSPSDVRRNEQTPTTSSPVILSAKTERKIYPEVENNQVTIPELPEEYYTNAILTTASEKVTSTVSSTTVTTTAPPTTEQPSTTTADPLPKNCYEVLQHGNWTSGVYSIQPGDMAPIQV